MALLPKHLETPTLYHYACVLCFMQQTLEKYHTAQNMTVLQPASLYLSITSPVMTSL